MIKHALKYQFLRSVVSYRPNETVAAGPSWMRFAKGQRKFRWIVTLDCGHDVERRACNFDETNTHAYCEWCADEMGVAL